jgi:diguanylate cyclase (GGDEF)-like protein
MRLRSRLTLFFLVIVIGPVAAGLLVGRTLAQRQSVARADSLLGGASDGVQGAFQDQVRDVRRSMTQDLALRAFRAAASHASLEPLQRGSGLDYLVVSRSGTVVASALRQPEYASGVTVTASELAGGQGRMGLVSDLQVQLQGEPGGAVWGGLFRDRSFLESLHIEDAIAAATVANGRVVASTRGAPRVGDVHSTDPMSLPGGWRGLCLCGLRAGPSGRGAEVLSGAMILVRAAPVGLIPPLGGAVLVALAFAMAISLLLAYLLARLVSRPIQRLADEATASLPEGFGSGPAPPADEVSRIDEALGALRAGLRQTTDELGGSQKELSRARAHLDDQKRLSLTDVLTGAWNRRYLEMALSDAMQRGRRRGRPFSVLMIDLDRFKKVNDRFGHQRGDEVLVEVCQRLGTSLRSNLDVLARYGGEEFVVLLPETEKGGAAVVAEKVRKVVRAEPFGASGHAVQVTVSIGVASFPEDGDEPDELVSVADANLYRAKRAGRDRIMAFAAGGAEQL